MRGSSGAARGVGAAVLVAAPIACAVEWRAADEAPRIDAVQPAVVTVGQPTPILIQGAGFYLQLRADPAAPRGVHTERRFRGVLGERELGELVWLDNAQLAATVPADLTLGTHDLTVTVPSGRRATLAAAVTVVCVDADQDGVCDDVNPCADRDADGICDAEDDCVDVDGDGLGDGSRGNGACAATAVDVDDHVPTRCADLDADACDDCSGGSFDPAADGPDTDGDGLCDVLECPPGVALCCPANAAFTAGTSTDIANGAWALVSADLNEDGIADLAGVNRTTGDAYVLLAGGSDGRGDGTFTVATYAVGTTPYAIAAADLDADSIPDLVVALRDSEAVAVLWGQGTDGRASGTFGPIEELALAALAVSRPNGIVVADFDADRIPDLATANRDLSANDAASLGGVAVLLGQGQDGRGNRSFAAPASWPTGSYARDLVAGDFDADGITDLAVAIWNSGNVDILLGTGSTGRGDGGFAAPQSIAVDRAQPAIATADLEGDGILDLVVPCRDTQAVWLVRGLGADGRGNGTFLLGPSYATGAQPVDVAVADLDGDTLLDFVVPEWADGTARLFLANGADGRADGTFATPAPGLTVGTNPIAAVTLEGNGDGLLDLAVANQGSATVTWFRHTGSGRFPDGTLVPAAAVDAGVGPATVLLADLDGDELLDVVVGSAAPAPLSLFAGQGSDGRGSAALGPVRALGQAWARPMLLALDADGDRIRDLVAARPGDESVEIFFGGGTGGRGDGTFAPAVTADAGGPAQGLAATDTDADAIVDLLVAVGDAGVSLLRANGNDGAPDGTLAAPVTYPLTGFVDGLAVGDVDADGIVDAVATSSSGGLLWVLRGGGSDGRGDGTLEPGASELAADGPRAPALADLDEDGVLDLVALASTTAAVTVRWGSGSDGRGDGSFAAPTFVALAEAPVASAVADLDADADLDLLVAQANGTITTLLGDGAGGLAAGPATTLRAPLGGLAVGDLDRDGRPDAVVAEPVAGRLVVLRGGGTCTAP